jgi:arsenate reductase
MIEIYPNSTCTKSRNAITILEEKNIEFSIRNYMDNPLNDLEIKNLQRLLQVPLIDMIRTKESTYINLFGSSAPSEEELLQALLQYPILLQRPIVVNGNRAVIARPPERVLEIL